MRILWDKSFDLSEGRITSQKSRNTAQKETHSFARFRKRIGRWEIKIILINRNFRII